MFSQTSAADPEQDIAWYQAELAACRAEIGRLLVRLHNLEGAKTCDVDKLRGALIAAGPTLRAVADRSVYRLCHEAMPEEFPKKKR